MRLADKVSIVTGLDSEGARATAVCFAREGSQVVGSCKSLDKGREAADTIGRDGGKIVLVEGDVSKPADAEDLVKRAVQEFGRLDIVVNFGASRRIVGTILDISDEDFDEEMAADLKSLIWLSRFAVPAMAENGGGAIVNMSSIARLGVKGRALRSASKAALSALTRAMALDHGEQNIRVNALLVGPTLTAELQQRPGQVELLESESPMGALATAEDVAAAALFLASDEARHITGVLLPVDAGRSLPTF